MRMRKTAEARKAEIIGAALKLADKLGPDRLTMEAVADAVGLTQPGVFRHFPTKQDLWEAVGAAMGSRMEARWATALRDHGSTVDRLHALVAAQLRLIQSTPAIPAILFSRELHARDKGLRMAFFALMNRLHRLLANLVAEGRAAGELRPDLDPDDAAYLILGLVQGLAVRWSVSDRAFDLPAEGARLLALLLDGFAAPRAAVVADMRES